VSVSSNGSAGNDDSGSAAITADGNIVAFQSSASNLVFSDSNNAADVFVHDRTRGVTELVSVTTTRGQGNSGSVEPALSADGNLVVFRSYATNLVAGDANGKEDVFIRDRAAKTVRRMSVSTTGAEADQDCFAPAISADGSVVAYCSAAATLVAGDTNGKVDVFIRDRTSGNTERVSVDSSGLQGDGDCSGPALSSDGRLVAFGSASTNLVAGDTNARPDVFLHDRTTGTTTLVTINRALDPGNNASDDTPSLCDDGSVVAFASLASNLVIGDTNRSDDVFADDLTVPPLIASWNNYGAGYPGTLGVPTLTSSADPVFGTSISIDASNSSGIWSEGVVVLGLSSSSIPTSAGGELLVDPFLYLLLPLLPGGGSIDAIVPRDMELCGLSVYMQVLELDAGAAHGISFTPGLQLAFGQ
jgi:Tol biopolymer transport system component